MSPKSHFRQASLCFSSLPRFECVNRWTIKSFKRNCISPSLKLGHYQTLSSAPFAADLEAKSMWVLTIQKCSHLRIEKDREFLIILRLKPSEAADLSSIEAYYSIRFARANGKTCFSYSDHSRVSVGSIAMSEYFSMKDIDSHGGALEDDEDIIITSKIVACGERFNLLHCLPAKSINKISQIDEDYLKLLDSGEFSDFTIEADGASFKAHKAILANKSEYFKAMFTHNTIEASTNHVKLNDIEPEVMRAILKYIYSGKTDLESLGEKSIDGEGEEEEETEKEEEKKKEDIQTNLDGENDNPTKTRDFYLENSFAIDLLKVSDLFQLEKLKQNCELALCDKVSIKSAVDLWKLANIYRAVDLKNRVIQFMIIHAKEFLGSGRLRELAKENPELSTDLLGCLSESIA